MRNLSKKSGVNTRVFPIYTPLQVLSLKEESDLKINLLPAILFLPAKPYLK